MKLATLPQNVLILLLFLHFSSILLPIKSIFLKLCLILISIYENNLNYRVRPRKIYYTAISNYYCIGDGKIPGLEKIRFFLDIKTMPYYFEIDDEKLFRPNHKEVDEIRPVYERDCSE